MHSRTKQLDDNLVVSLHRTRFCHNTTTFSGQTISACSSIKLSKTVPSIPFLSPSSPINCSVLTIFIGVAQVGEEKKKQFIFLSHFSSGISIKDLHECAVNPNGQRETFRFMLNYNRYFWANIHQKDMSKLRHDFFFPFFFFYFSNTCSFNTCHKRFILRHHVTEKTSYNKTSS